MKHLLPVIITVFLTITILSAHPQTIFLQNNTENSLEILSQSKTDFDIDVSLGQIEAEEISTPWGNFTSLALPDFSGNQMAIGQAFLPEIHKLIDIPYDAQVQVEVISAESREIELADYQLLQPVLPYQGPIEKTEEALAAHQFQMDQKYYRHNGYPEQELVSFEQAGNLRGHRLGILKIRAVEYLPALNRIKIYQRIRIHLRYQNPDLQRTAQIHKKYQSPYFSPLLKEFTANYTPATEDLTQYPVYYAVIYADILANALQPLIDWKLQKGFQVITEPISAIGNTTTNIRNYIEGLYNGPNPPTFVLLVGDIEQIASYTGQTGGHVSDLYYTTMTTGDFVPDIYIGRLSAQSESQLTAQINKILFHEKYQFPQTTFLNHGCFAATDDGGNYTVAEGTHNYVINTHFIPNNLLFDKLYAITYGSTGQDVINAVNDGRFILNYSGHGSTTSWGGPSVNQAMVRNTTNVNMYPFVISNACLTGSFEVSECFGETWVREADGGGLAFTGASNSTYWSEDDEWERRAYDGVFWEDYYSLAAFILRGNLAVLNAGYSLAQYYFEVYHLFGDPSLMLYWGEPDPMTVNASTVVFIGSPVYDVTVVNEDSALVSLYMDGINYGSALTDANGQAQIQLNPVPTTPGNMLLTITKFNRQPYVDTLQVIPASGPYLYCLGTVIDDQATNNNHIPEAGENLNFSLQLANVGVANAENVQATLSCSEPMVTIHSGQSSLGTIQANDTALVGNFTVEFSGQIPHMATCALNLHLEDSAANSWDQTLYMQIHEGGKIAFSSTQIDFPNTFLTFSSMQNLDIKNTGADTLWINDVNSNLPEFSMTPVSAVIAPGNSQSFTVSFTPQATQLYQGLISISNTDPVWFDTTIVVSGTGIYAPDIACTPDSISMEVNVTDSVVIPIQIRNEGLGELIYNAQIAGYQNNDNFIEGSGGADNFGHIWIDSDEPSGPDFQWIDISQTGVEVALTGNNSISEQIPLGFTFPFYGQDFSSVRACTNGWLSLSTFSVSYNNVALPNVLAPRSLIAPLWDDLNFTTGSKFYYQQEVNKTIFMYQDVYRVTGEGPLTFEVVLYENGNIILQYLQLDNLVHDYTVGIQNQDASDGLTIAFNETYLKDSLTIIISKHSWATVSPLSGVLAPQSIDSLYLTLRTSNFPMGEFWASIQVESNDPDEAIYVIPIHMVVDSVTVSVQPLSDLIPDKFQLYQNWPNPFNPSTTIKYSLPEKSEVKLEIFNIIGQRIRTLVSGNQVPGNYQIQWDGKNEFGQTAASGVYIYRLQADKQVAIRKMIFMR